MRDECHYGACALCIEPFAQRCQQRARQALLVLVHVEHKLCDDANTLWQNTRRRSLYPAYRKSCKIILLFSGIYHAARITEPLYSAG